jgi:Trk-type K+ transport system membrane component
VRCFAATVATSIGAFAASGSAIATTVTTSPVAATRAAVTSTVVATAPVASMFAFTAVLLMFRAAVGGTATGTAFGRTASHLLIAFGHCGFS